MPLNNLQKGSLLIIFFLILISYFILKKLSCKENQKSIHIPQLKIESKPTQLDEHSTILSILQSAVQKSRKSEDISEDERAREILAQLKNHIPSPTEEIDAHILEELAKMNSLIEVKSTDKKESSFKIIEKRKVEHRKKIIHKKRAVHKKKTVHKKRVVDKKRTIHKKKIVHKKKVTHPKKIAEKKSINKKPLVQKSRQLSREEEVRAYQAKHQGELEVVSQSQVFEINEPKTKKTDSYYFKQHDPSLNQPVELNRFVKTLGVVKISKVEEVSVTIPPKIELAQDNIVDISTASIETRELKKLQFVKPIEVVEVSEAFEASEAKKYLK